MRKDVPSREVQTSHSSLNLELDLRSSPLTEFRTKLRVWFCKSPVQTKVQNQTLTPLNRTIQQITSPLLGHQQYLFHCESGLGALPSKQLQDNPLQSQMKTAWFCLHREYNIKVFHLLGDVTSQFQSMSKRSDL
jgi:hypothetical protein